jgi:tellurite resistance protein
LLGVPVASLGDTGEHLRCTICHTCYRVDLLAVPTMEQMLVALLAGTKAAVVAMLRAGGSASQAARRRGIQLIRDAGAPEYDDGRLATALADPEAAPRLPDADGTVVALRPAIEAFSVQLEIPAREWFLAKIVEVGLADGSLSAAERDVARTVARHLGMSAARGRDVISLAEEAAQAG